MAQVNIFGKSGNKETKHISLDKEIKSKVKKSGDRMTGDLDMNGNSILNISDPTNESDCVTKRYHDVNIDLLRRGIRTISNNVINDIERIDRVSEDLRSNLQLLFDRVNNVEITYTNIEILLKVGNIISMLQLGVIGSSSYFDVKLRQVQTLYDIIAKLYKDEVVKKLKLFENQKFVLDFRNEVMRDILDLSENDFSRLKENLESNKLLKNVEGWTVSMDFVVVVNELDRMLKPGHKYNELKLLIQKNLVLIKLGYVFIHDGLLSVIE